MNILIGILLAVVIAEVISAMMHHAEDRYGNIEWIDSKNPILRFIGKNVVSPNIEHHQFPGRICYSSYWERNNTTIIPSLILAACFWWCWPICLGFLIMSQSNQIHMLSHKKSNSFIRFLQKIRILNSPKLHAIHHKMPFSTDFAVITGFMNPILNFIRFWTILEIIYWVLFGIRPLKVREIY